MTAANRLDALGRRVNALGATQQIVVPDVGEVPDVIEFATSEKYLAKRLYPRQALLLKMVFLAVELLTPYDRQVIDHWASTFTATGNNGVSPDVVQRMEICRDQGRRWFREVIAVIGRRGGKGYISAIALAYVLWVYLGHGSPQDHYGIDPNKRIVAMVFGPQRDQARDNLWRDLAGLIRNAPCFAPFIAQVTSDSVLLFTPADLGAIAAGTLPQEPASASIEISARASTLTAGRGPAAFAIAFDEMAHVVATGANRSAEELYHAATPALDQFGLDGFIIEPSSPWQQTGQFHQNYRDGLAVDELDQPLYPSKVVVQLTSWDPYEDWEIAHTLEMVPGGDTFPRFKRAVQTYDDEMRQLEQANPETFAVERRSHFRTTMTPYLDPSRVEKMFDTYDGNTLQMRRAGDLGVRYKIHTDPALSVNNFAVAVAHCETDDHGRRHVVFDLLDVWKPTDFPDNNNHIDYEVVTDELIDLWDAFQPAEFTSDQWNSAGALQRIERHARASARRPGASVIQRDANRDLNWKRAETFKTALYEGRVHAPAHELARLELLFLEERNGRVDHPSSGPVQTNDLVDCMFECAHYFLADHNADSIGAELSSLSLRATDGDALRRISQTDPIHQALSAFGRTGGPHGAARLGRGPRL